MTTPELLLSAWDWEPSVMIGCLALAIGYVLIVRKSAPACTAYFLGGLLLLLLDLVSPIDALGDTYLFSAHVLQHFLLALIIPILLLLGMPAWVAETALKRRFLRQAESAIGHPPVSWALGVGTMLLWHVPVLFNAALANDELHIFQHLSLLVTGTVFWWPVLTPLKENRTAPLAAIVYLFSACTACSLLGALLTFSAPGAYPDYLEPRDRLGVLQLIRASWGLDAKSDQQLGGMLMWVPGCFVYLSAILANMARWYRMPERAEMVHAPAGGRLKTDSLPSFAAALEKR